MISSDGDISIYAVITTPVARSGIISCNHTCGYSLYHEGNMIGDDEISQNIYKSIYRSKALEKNIINSNLVTYLY